MADISPVKQLHWGSRNHPVTRLRVRANECGPRTRNFSFLKISFNWSRSFTVPHSLSFLRFTVPRQQAKSGWRLQNCNWNFGPRACALWTLKETTITKFFLGWVPRDCNEFAPRTYKGVVTSHRNTPQRNDGERFSNTSRWKAIQWEK